MGVEENAWHRLHSSYNDRYGEAIGTNGERCVKAAFDTAGEIWIAFPVKNKFRGVHMLSFEFEFGDKHSSTLIQKYPDVLRYEGFFLIKIGTRCFFEDEHFCILEFLLAIQSWLDNHEEQMMYNTMEADDTPILKFSKQETGMWRISSVWQKFDCEQEFEKTILFLHSTRCFSLLELGKSLRYKCNESLCFSA